VSIAKVVYAWRGAFTNDEVNVLHAEAFDHPFLDIDWSGQLERFGLGWVCARSDSADGALLGFVKVIWDGDVHAFILDTMTAAAAQRRGIGRELVAIAAREAKAAGCEWLHVDFEPHLAGFYYEACGFRPTEAGLIALR
jgi:ribosomal protein S18 acetylase RimI-like enzyme